MKSKYIYYNSVVIIITIAVSLLINTTLRLPRTATSSYISQEKLYFHDTPEEFLNKADKNTAKYTENFNDVYRDIYYSPDIFDPKEKTPASPEGNKDAKEVFGSDTVSSIEKNITASHRMEILKIMTKVPAKDTIKIVFMMRDGITSSEQDEIYLLLKDKLGEKDLQRLLAILKGYAD